MKCADDVEFSAVFLFYDMTCCILTIISVSPTAAAGIEEAAVIGDPIQAGTTSMAFPSIMHKDAFLIFRALCKLSMKGLHESDESGSLSDPIALQNK
jgi:hypothetical protein